MNANYETKECNHQINKNLSALWFVAGTAASGAFAYIEITYNQRTGAYAAVIEDGNFERKTRIASGQLNFDSVMKKVDRWMNNH